MFREGDIKKGLKELAPKHTHEIDKMHFRDITGYVSSSSSHYKITNYLFRTLEESVRESMKFLQESPFLRPELKEGVAGFVYDIKTGKLSRIGGDS